MEEEVASSLAVPAVVPMAALLVSCGFDDVVPTEVTSFTVDAEDNGNVTCDVALGNAAEVAARIVEDSSLVVV